jgi:ATP-dependent RNA helicase DeaD
MLQRKMNGFAKLGLSKRTLDLLESINFVEPTDIQRESIPAILEGKDVIGNAATGSGKTLAFSSVIIEKIVPGNNIQALVLAPTRELAEQISGVMRTFAKNAKLNIVEVYGGVSIEGQIRNMRNADVVVGTPGRILDHLQRGTLDLSALRILVLDEADRMVDMGFLPDVERIMSQCPEQRQTLLFSATTSPDVEYMEKKYMQAPKYISVETYVDASKLKQYFYNTPSHIKFSLLAHFLKQEESGVIMVFCNTRRNVDLLGYNLKRYGIDSLAIHGGMEQRKRSRIMEMFHGNKVGIMICTDVAARGLDIKGVTHVYNYDIPKTSDEYIHRIGRTARAGAQGLAISLVSNNDYDNFRRVMSDDSLKIEEKEVPEVEKLTPHFKDRDSRGGFRPGNRGRDSGNRGGFRGRDSGSSRSGPERGRHSSRDSGHRRSDSRRGFSPRGARF